jgi:aryl-alcohol dehydrogenase-like predicted oxidoreductase
MSRSKLVLGTVQLGMPYGLNNTSGQPSREGSLAILDAAFENGIDIFDTAHAYGSAEDVLGDWIMKRSREDGISVISKMKPHVLNEYPDGAKAGEVVEEQICKSLERLHLKSLDGYLLHSPYYMYVAHVIDGLQKAKKKGLVRNIGVSIYDEDEALQAVELGVDYIQVPYNALDQRLDRTEFFTLAKKNRITVFARSPFLQGLLLMDPSALPPHLSHARPLLENFITLTEKHGLSRVEACMLFVTAHCRAEHIVVGVESLTQLKEVTAAFSRKPSASDDIFVKEVADRFKNIERGIVNPSLWNNIKR